MAPATVDLDAITIASPCTVPWASMRGDEVKRFCGQCRLHVHDVSAMTRAEVVGLLEETGGTCCLRLWRRPDGRVITKDCDRVRRAIARRVRAVRTAAAALLALVGLSGCRHAAPAPAAHMTMGTPPTPQPAMEGKDAPPAPGATVTTGR